MWIVAIIILPAALPAQSGHRSSAPARATFRGSSAASRHTRAVPQAIPISVAHVAAAARPDHVLPAAPASVSLAARTSAQTSFFSAPRAQSERGPSRGFNSGGIRHQRSFGMRRADDPQPPAPAPVYIPPYDYTPGALIRTEGLGYKTTPTNDAHWANNDLGYAIVIDPDKMLLLDPFPGAHIGPADKRPPPNPGVGGSASGRNAITQNPPANGSEQ